tara:strand:- start:38846 stop:39349 length:504 start_codon:yes stop_codon:yes gene_type:complete
MKDARLRNRRRQYRAIMLVAMLGTLALGGGALAAEPVGPDLTEKLRGLLVREMVAIESAMLDIYSAIVQGNHTTVAQQGQAIHDSFILKLSLTKEDRQDLKAAVPQEFLQLDARFHKLAALLAKAGEEESTQEQVEIFNRMTESCIACHSRYVTDRFEGLQNQLLPE